MPRRLSVCCAPWVCPVLLAAFPADFSTGMAAYERGDFRLAAGEWQAAANDGDAAAKFWLGELYLSGLGVGRDEALGRQLGIDAAEHGYEYAQNALGWPIKPENTPYLTCGPDPPSDAPDEARSIPADSLNDLRFRITLHNMRPLLEPLTLAADNVFPKREAASVSVAVYRIENGRRVDVPHAVFTSGGGMDNPRGPIRDESLVAGIHIPVEESQRRLFVEQFLVELEHSPGETPDQLQQARQLMLHFDHPNEPSYLDSLMPNRIGSYEIVCRYQSAQLGYLREDLDAVPFRFDYVKKFDWIQRFTRKDTGSMTGAR